MYRFVTIGVLLRINWASHCFWLVVDISNQLCFNCLSTCKLLKEIPYVYFSHAPCSPPPTQSKPALKASSAVNHAQNQRSGATTTLKLSEVVQNLAKRMGEELGNFAYFGGVLPDDKINAEYLNPKIGQLVKDLKARYETQFKRILTKTPGTLELGDAKDMLTSPDWIIRSHHVESALRSEAARIKGLENPGISAKSLLLLPENGSGNLLTLFAKSDKISTIPTTKLAKNNPFLHHNYEGNTSYIDAGSPLVLPEHFNKGKEGFADALQETLEKPDNTETLDSFMHAPPLTKEEMNQLLESSRHLVQRLKVSQRRSEGYNALLDSFKE
jgi:hypothetical protein